MEAPGSFICEHILLLLAVVLVLVGVVLEDVVLEGEGAEPEQRFGECEGVLAEQLHEGAADELQELGLLFVPARPLVVGEHGREGAEGVGLEEQPLAVEQLLDLLQVVENGLVQFLAVGQEAVVLEEPDVLADDAVLGHDRELRLLVVLAFLEAVLLVPGGLGRLLLLLRVRQAQLDHLLLVVVLLLLLLALEDSVGLDGEDLAVGVGGEQFEELVGDFEEEGEDALVGDEVEPDPEYLRDVVAEHVGHEDVGVLALAHVHGVGEVRDHVQVGVEQLQPRVEEVDLELFLLLALRLPREDLVDEFEVRRLHDLDDPAEAELGAVAFDLARCLRPLLAVLGARDLERPATQQQVLDDVVVHHLARLPEHPVEHQLDQLLELHLQELPAHLLDHLPDRLDAPLTLHLQPQELNRYPLTFSSSLSASMLVTFFISACLSGAFRWLCNGFQVSGSSLWTILLSPAAVLVLKRGRKRLWRVGTGFCAILQAMTLLWRVAWAVGQRSSGLKEVKVWQKISMRGRSILSMRGERSVWTMQRSGLNMSSLMKAARKWLCRLRCLGLLGICTRLRMSLMMNSIIWQWARRRSGSGVLQKSAMWTMSIWKHSCLTKLLLYSRRLPSSFSRSSGLSSSLARAVSSCSSAITQKESFLSSTCSTSSSSRSLSTMLNSARISRDLGLTGASWLISRTRSRTDSSQCGPLMQASRTRSLRWMERTAPSPCMLKMILLLSSFSSCSSSWSIIRSRSQFSSSSRRPPIYSISSIPANYYMNPTRQSLAPLSKWPPINRQSQAFGQSKLGQWRAANQYMS